MRWFLLACALVLAACIQSGLVPCGDQLCPKGDMCISGVCASADQLATCSGQPDGTACTLTSGSVGRCANGICLAGGCGNHRLDPGEACDDGNIKAGDGCSGTCDSDESCGNGILDVVTGESCDCGADAAHMPASCTAPNSDDPSSACTTSCQLRRCGDGEVAGPEQCDGPGTVAITCDRFGYYSGEVTCSSLCQYDPSSCSERCGDGIVQSAYEVCDTLPPDNQTCLDFGFDLGWMGCTSVCTQGLADCDRLGLTRVHPRVATPRNVIVRGNRMLVLFANDTVSLMIGDTAYDPPGTFSAIAGTSTHSYAIGASGVKEFDLGPTWTDLPVTPPWTAGPWSAWASDTLGLFMAVRYDPYVYNYNGGTSLTPYTIQNGPYALPLFGSSASVPYLFDMNGYKASSLASSTFATLNLPPTASSIYDIAETSMLYFATNVGLLSEPVAGTFVPLGLQAQRLVSNTLGGIDVLTSTNTVVRVGVGDLGFTAPTGTTAISEDGGAVYLVGLAAGVFAVLKGAWQMLAPPSSTARAYMAIHGGNPLKGDEILVAGDYSAFQQLGHDWVPLSSVPVGTRDVALAGTQRLSIQDFSYTLESTGQPTQIRTLVNVDPNAIFYSPDDHKYVIAGSGGVVFVNELDKTYQEVPLPYKLYGISGLRATDFYVVGGDVNSGAGVLVHYDGSSWTPINTGFSPETLRDVYAAPSGAIFTIAAQHLYQGRLGGPWKSITIPGSDLRAVGGTSENDVFVAGGTAFGFSFSGLAHWDGSHFYPVRLPSTGLPHDIYVTRGAVYMLLQNQQTNTDDIWSLVRSTPW